MAIVKATYTKVRTRAKQNIRYITHRRDRDDHTVTRTLFGYDGTLTKDQAYTIIDEARVGTVFFRMVISPAPKREDRLRDLNLQEIRLSDSNREILYAKACSTPLSEQRHAS